MVVQKSGITYSTFSTRRVQRVERYNKNKPEAIFRDWIWMLVEEEFPSLQDHTRLMAIKPGSYSFRKRGGRWSENGTIKGRREGEELILYF